MDETQIQQIADRLIEAVEGLAPGPPGWWVIAPPIAVFVAAFVALGIGLLNYFQKRKADARSEWWRRAQWALEARTAVDNPMLRDSGSAVLYVLAASNKPSAEERDLLEVVLESPDVRYLDEDIDTFTESEARDGDGETGDLDEATETGDNGATKEVSDGSREGRRDRRGS